jgi:hypothetical protein
MKIIKIMVGDFDYFFVTKMYVHLKSTILKEQGEKILSIR